MAATPSHSVRVNATTRVSHRVSTTGLMDTIDFHMVVNACFEQQDVIDITSYPPRPSDSDSDSDSSTPSPEQVEENRELEWNKFMRSTIGKLCPLLCPCRGLEAARQQERAKDKKKSMAAKSVTKKNGKTRQPLSQGVFKCKRCGEFGTPLRRCTVCGRHSFGSAMYTISRVSRSAPTEGELI